MNRTLAAAIAACMVSGAAIPARAVDGHGNAERPELIVPNTGSISGGTTHRDDPRFREARERTADGRPLHYPGDGHAHGHSH
ncbi:hypothetical protein [Methylobacterium symbioticum]|uniref:Uncharacterized protein n=1 Tax=Methylobacterium symbioticum TaxID=2584084 RepID=A0A509E7S0_9HYPH|nr:hypothetical protein [Methylobacterium symbioticum]VUD70178.1 hypothetical protein MET9862_00741 [Methylobacterium symbioticum]